MHEKAYSFEFYFFLILNMELLSFEWPKWYWFQCNVKTTNFAHISRVFSIVFLRCDRFSDTTQTYLNTLRPRQNGRLFPDDIFKWIFWNENIWISLRISLKFVPRVRIDNIPALVQIMAWRRPGDKLLSEPMMVSLLTHICVTRPQWVKLHQDVNF